MRATSVLVFLFNITLVFGQEERNSDTIGLGITSYPFYFNQELKLGSIAIGPSFLMNADRFAVQFSILIDTRAYTVIEPSHFGSSYYKEPAGFLGMFINYKYLRPNNRLQFFVMGGGLLGKRHYAYKRFDGNYGASASWLLGTGASFQLLNKIELRTSLNISRGKKIYSPGMFVDVLINLIRRRSESSNP